MNHVNICYGVREKILIKKHKQYTLRVTYKNSLIIQIIAVWDNNHIAIFLFYLGFFIKTLKNR